MENTIVDTVKALMAQRNWRMADLVRASGLPQPTIWFFLNRGNLTNPYPDTVQGLCKAFGITENQLRGLDPIDIEIEASKIAQPFKKRAKNYNNKYQGEGVSPNNADNIGGNLSTLQIAKIYNINDVHHILILERVLHLANSDNKEAAAEGIRNAVQGYMNNHYATKADRRRHPRHDHAQTQPVPEDTQG
jgi:transcriptional regulator with XRE-family HTH domain